MNSKKQNFPHLRSPKFLAAIIVVAALFVVPNEAAAAGANNQKLYIYQGVISVAPDSANVMEIGNAGADIATNGSINLRPGSGGTVIVGPRGTPTDGARLSLAANAPYPVWNIESFANSLRFLNNGTSRLSIDSTGDFHILGSLCFGGGGTDCASAWNSVGPTNQDLETTLRDYGNFANQPMVIGRGTGTLTPTAILEGNTRSGAFPAALNAVSAKLDAPVGGRIDQGAAVVGFNNIGGHAAYFSGRVGIFDTGVANPGFGSGTTLRIAGSFPPVSVALASVLQVDNSHSTFQGTTGNGVKLTGAVDISGYGSGTVSPAVPEASLLLDGSITGPFSFGMDALRIVGAPTTGKALYATAANASGAANTTWAVYGEIRNSTWYEPVSSNPATSSFAGILGGFNIIEGQTTVKPFGGSMPWGLRIGVSTRAKQHPDLQVCEMSSDTCYGKYVYTSGTGRRGVDRGTTQFCYENAGAIQCRNVYVSGIGCLGSGPSGLQTRSPSGTSYFSGFNCSGVEFVSAVVTVPNTKGQPASQICVSGTDSSQSMSYMWDSLGCRVVPSPGILTFARTLFPPTTELIQALELR